MKNHLVIKDLVQFKLLDPKLTEIKDSYFGGNAMQTSNQPFGGKKALVVRLAATHAGIVTGNNTFYMPDKMREGVPTFMSNYGKPILTHHNEEQDPIGRIIDAKYIDTSKTLRDSTWMGKEVRDSAGRVQGTINDKLLNDLVDGKMPFGQAVDVVRNIFDNSVLQDPNYEGLGYAEIIAEITDKDAIEKFLDGRYLTGSVSASTDRAVCSHCRTDWTQDGRCDHVPGSVEDGKKVYLIAGKFDYSEYSMVNKPADRHSKVLELYYNGVKDSVQIAKDSSRITEVNVGFPQYELNDKVQEDGLMSAKKKPEGTPEVKDNIETPVEEKKNEVVTPEAPVEPKVEDTKVEPETFEALLTRMLDASYELVAQDEEAAYNKMLDEMKSLGLSDKDLEDTKLSQEKRAKLAKSSFAGPHRTLPVTDAAHALAAQKLLNNYKGDTKNVESFLQIVNRKAKVLGASKLSDKLKSADKQVTDRAGVNTIMQQLLQVLEQNSFVAPDQVPALGDEEVNTVRTMLQKLAAVVSTDSLAKAAGLEKLGLDTAAEKTFLDEISSLEELVGTLRDEITKTTEDKNAIKEEYDILFSEMNALQDSVVELKTSTRQSKLDKLNLLTNLKEGVVKDRNESFLTLNDQTIDTQLETISSEVDMNKIVVKLNDGMSRIPTGELENPVDVQDSKPKASEVVRELKVIEENFTKLSLRDKISADRYLKAQMSRLRNEGKIPKE